MLIDSSPSQRLHDGRYFLLFDAKKAFTLQMSPFSYKTIQAASEALFKEKGSRFLAFAFPVESEDDVRERLLELRKKYFDARHHCYAYRIGVDEKRFRANDDGEPNHSAGDPILGQIRSKELTNILIIVVRYFGGTKLGVGGLIAAYKTAASEALTGAVIIEKEIFRKLEIEFDFAFTQDVMKLVKEFDLMIIDQRFEDHSFLEAQCKLRAVEKLQEKLSLFKKLDRILSFKITDE